MRLGDRKKSRFALVVCLTGVLAVIVWVQMAATSLDGVSGAIISIPFHDTTVYAPNYTDAAYRRIKVGETEEDVRKMLGEPFEHDSPDGYVARWRYAKSRSDSHYRMRQVSFKNGRVVSKEHYLLVD
jgi:outer membrane protein assembly factor BamE (lipoprotein component of BamABCDE complex)